MRDARVEADIELHSGVYTEEAVVSTPLTVRAGQGFDPDVYVGCMRLHGFEPDAADDTYLRVVEACREEVRPLSAARIEKIRDGVRLPTSHDPAAMDACVRRALGGVEVEVEVPEREPALE